jgi:predicted nucleic acid-binding protein
VAVYLLDANALVKHYHPEVGTMAVDQLFEEIEARRLIARLTVVEVHAALGRKVREGVLSASELAEVYGRLFADITRRRLQVIRMTDEHYRTAERLVCTYGPVVGEPRLRTLDALQLAVALDVHQRQPLDGFVVADDDLAAVAQREQLPVRNPLRG